MRRVPVNMPQLGEALAEATLIEWLVQPGDEVSEGDSLCELETDKASTQLAAPASGKVLELLGIEGKTYAVGHALAWLEDPGHSDASPHESAPPARSPGEDPVYQLPKPVSHLSSDPATLRGAAVDGAASWYSPATRAWLAREGLEPADLGDLIPTGQGGRPTLRDLDQWKERLFKDYQIQEIGGMRVTVAEAMSRSWQRPIALVARKIPLQRLLVYRKQNPLKASMTVYFMLALARAIATRGSAIGRWLGGRLAQPRDPAIGCAVERPNGVLVPTWSGLAQTGLSDFVPRYQEGIEAARQGILKQEGRGLATLSNYGVFGVTRANPIPLPTQPLLLGTGMGVQEPVWDESVGGFSPVTCSECVVAFDHRVMDGAEAGALLAEFDRLLQHPEELAEPMANQ